jgi:NTE family protein
VEKNEEAVAAKKNAGEVEAPASSTKLPGQVVLVLQGGGALGAYQAGVYEALHDANIEPDWVIGTSIGAINGAIIAGNRFDDRLLRLRAFWQSLKRKSPASSALSWFGFGNAGANLATLTSGVPGLFSPNVSAIWGLHANVGAERASFYSTEDLRSALLDFVDFTQLQARCTRLTVGAVNVRSGEMR